ISMWPTPHTMAMIASVKKAAAVSPAATWPPLEFMDEASDAAPTPSASVDRPTSAVSAPQTMKRMPTKSTWVFTPRLSDERWLDGDANFDFHGAGVRRGDPKTERRAVADACRHRDTHRVEEQRL